MNQAFTATKAARHWRSLSALIVGLTLSITSHAYSGRATDEAFAALLSMPGAGPEHGSWNFEKPKSFTKYTEPNLIDWLEKKKKEGADLNAQRHFGTLLHHAIRADLESTALWLIKNGAATQQKNWVANSLQAVDLSISYQRHKVLYALLSDPALNANSDYQSRKNCFLPGALYKGNVTLALAFTARNTTPINPAKQRNCAVTSYTRSGSTEISHGFRENPASDLALLDSRLEQPLFLYVLKTLPASRQHIDWLFSLPLRKPFDDRKFTQQVISTSMDNVAWLNLDNKLAPQLQEELLKKIPPQALQSALNDPLFIRELIKTNCIKTNCLSPNFFDIRRKDRKNRIDLLENLLVKTSASTLNKAFDDDETVTRWVASFSSEEPQRFASALQVITETNLHAHAKAAISALAQTSQFANVSEPYQQGKPSGKSSMRYSVGAQIWGLLLNRLPPNLDSSEWPQLAGQTDPEIWPVLFERGYQITSADSALGCSFSAYSPEQIKKIWPLLVSHYPAIKQDAIRLTLMPFIPHRAPCFSSIPDQSVVEKVRFLKAQGSLIRPFVLSGNGTKEIVQQLITLGAAQLEQQAVAVAATSSLSQDVAHCQFNLNGGWYKALLNNPVISKEDWAVYVETVQLVENPGSTECALLVNGSQRVDDYVSGLVDSFTGPESNPRPSCPDPTDKAEIWTKDTKSNLFSIQSFSPGGVTPLRDSQNKQRYFFQWWEGFGQCARSQGYLYAWKRINQQWQLAPLDDNHPAAHAFLQNCDSGKVREFEEALTCLGMTSSKPVNAVEGGKPELSVTKCDPYQGCSLQGFIDTYKTIEHKAYIDAVLALDKPKLKSLEAEGIAPHWTWEAIQSVTESLLPLAEKRKRTAWIFRNHKQLTAAMRSDTLEKLIDWLPREDWWPVLEAARGNSYLFEHLQKIAKNQGKHQLACDFDNARGRICGESISDAEGNTDAAPEEK